ncbi:MAG: SCO family protein [Bacteroidota bacterium]|nr:SCO family protein [Bacteroidota bacterium]MEC8835365.1 SCO family protein [Bacteroidota bacterium]
MTKFFPSLFLSLWMFIGCDKECDVEITAYQFKDPQPLPSFALESAFGQSIITQDDLAKQYVVLDFFFTSCPSICPKMSGNMQRIQQELKGLDGFSLVSISIDERRDNIQRLREYAALYEADTNTWSFLRGSKEEVFGLADALKIGVAESDLPTSGGFDHSGTFLVVTPDKKVTYFVTGDGTENHEIDDLICYLKKALTDK